MQSPTRALRRLSGYDVNEISLVRVPDINRRMAVFKSGDAPELTDDEIQEKTRVLKSGRVPPMDPMGNIIPDPNALDPAAQEALQNIARILAPVKDQLTSQDLLQMATQIGIPNMPESSKGILDEDYADDGTEDDADYGEDADVNGDDGDESDAEVTEDDADADSDYSEAEDPGPDEDEDPPADDDAPPPPAAAQAKQPAPADAKTGAPPNVHPADHAEAKAAAKGAYLSTLQKKGYKTSSGNKPKETNPMADKTKVVKSAIDWTKFTVADRERFEPIFKSVEDAHETNERLNEENKQLVQKSASLEDRLAAMEKEGEMKQLVQKTAEFRHLDDHEGLASIAMAIPAGEAREKFLSNLQAQNARIEKITKSGDLTREQGSTGPGREPEGASKWDTMLKEHVTKSAETLKPGAAEEALLATEAGRQAYLEYRSANGFV